MAAPTSDRGAGRMERLVEFVVQLVAGDLDARLEPSPVSDEMDAIVVGLNMLAEELQALTVDLETRVGQRTRQLSSQKRSAHVLGWKIRPGRGRRTGMTLFSRHA